MSNRIKYGEVTSSKVISGHKTRGQGRSGVGSGSSARGRFGVGLGSGWGRFGVRLGSVWGGFGSLGVI